MREKIGSTNIPANMLSVADISVSVFNKNTPVLGKFPLSQSNSPKENRPRGYKTFFMLNSVEHEVLNAHKYENINKFAFF